jgi:formamidopyrimidine-DNA glycosylase
MPELPEVETFVRQLRRPLIGRTIVGFDSSWPRSVSPSLRRLRSGVRGRSIVAVTRRAKLFILVLDDGGHVLIHLRMSGRLALASDCEAPDPFVRSWFDLDDNDRLLLCDSRKFGRITYTTDLAAATQGYGPEPLARGFTAASLGQILHSRARQLKPLLLDQAVIAGLGNIYTDEALFRAGLHPTLRSDTLTPDEIARLHAAIRGVLREAIRYHGTSIDWIYPGGWMQRRLKVYGRGGEPCRACGTPIAALRIGQRGTHVCPTCQPLRRRTARRRRRTA